MNENLQLFLLFQQANKQIKEKLENKKKLYRKNNYIFGA